MLAVDNHHLQRRLKDKNAYYVKSKWLAERKAGEKKLYTYLLNVEHKGWVVAPLIKEERLTTKTLVIGKACRGPSKPPQYSHAGISPVRPQSIEANYRTGGNKHRRTVEVG